MALLHWITRASELGEIPANVYEMGRSACRGEAGFRLFGSERSCVGWGGRPLFRPVRLKTVVARVTLSICQEITVTLFGAGLRPRRNHTLLGAGL